MESAKNLMNFSRGSINAKQCKVTSGSWKNNRCYDKYDVSGSPKKASKKLLLIVALLAILGVSSLILTNVGTFLHEAGGHALVAKMFGCKTSWNTNVFVGQTAFEGCLLYQYSNNVCSTNNMCNDGASSTTDTCLNGACVYENKTINLIIALSSIIIIFGIALFLWLKLDRDSLWRVLAIIMMFYSVIPSAYPLMPGSDMAYAVSQGFPIIIAWIIYLILAGVFMWLLIDEVADKPVLENILR